MCEFHLTIKKTNYKQMKTKISLCIIVVLLGINFVQAQEQNIDVSTPKTIDYLPKAGNFGIGADAAPVFSFIGNMFNNSTVNTLTLTMPVIYAKYYLSDMTALRAVLGIANDVKKEQFYIIDDAAAITNPFDNIQTIDRKTTINNDYAFSLAYQMFIGNKRLRGFYGGQFITEISSTKLNYSYGNPMTVLNPIPSSAYSFTATRTLEQMLVRDFKVGVGGVAGFEYYIMPRLCFGGEVSLNLLYTKGLQTYKKAETISSGMLVNVDQAIMPGDSDFSIQTVSFSPTSIQNLGLYLMFHF